MGSKGILSLKEQIEVAFDNMALYLNHSDIWFMFIL